MFSKPRTRKVKFAAAFVALGALLSGVGVLGKLSHLTPADEPKVETIASVTLPGQVALPLDPYLMSIQNWNIPDRAINILGRKCMRRIGLDWPITESTPPDSKQLLHANRYGLADAQQAHSSGYHLANAANQGWSPKMARDSTPDEAAAWAGRSKSTVAGIGIPPQGCAGEAVRTLEAGEPVPEINPEQLAFESRIEADNDSRVVAAKARWKSCMSRYGFSYDAPFSAATDPKWDVAEVTANERQVAEADVECKHQSTFIDVFVAVETAYQKRLIDDNRVELENFQKYHASLAARAARVVAEN